MQQRTLQKLRALKWFPWFENAGRPVPINCLTIKSWNEAVKLSGEEVWSSVQHQIKNRIADEVTKRNYHRSEQWNATAAEIRNDIAAIISQAVEPFEKRFGFGSDFRGAVSWDLLMICMETEFSDVVPPMFFVPRLEPVYASGHFPCGWEGPKLHEGWEGPLADFRLMAF